MGRFFSPRYEYRSMLRGIRRDLTEFAGHRVWWYRFDTETQMDAVYDMGMGREYHDPIAVDVISADRVEGAIQENEPNIYRRDFLYILVAWDELERRGLHDIEDNLTSYLRDRVFYDDKFFTPRNIKVRGALGEKETIVKIDLIEVREDNTHFDPAMAPVPVVPPE